MATIDCLTARPCNCSLLLPLPHTCAPARQINVWTKAASVESGDGDASLWQASHNESAAIVVVFNFCFAVRRFGDKRVFYIRRIAVSMVATSLFACWGKSSAKRIFQLLRVTDLILGRLLRKISPRDSERISHNPEKTFHSRHQRIIV